MEYVLIQYGYQVGYRMHMRALLVFIILVSVTHLTSAAQYQSRVLVKPDATEERKSIKELEESLSTLADPYAKSSTSRFLARHYLQTNHFVKAEFFYLETLGSDGLSDIAKQDVLEELAQLYIRLKRYNEALQSLADREALGGKKSAAVLLMQALANHYTDRKQQALELADAAWAEEKYPSQNFLEYIRFIYFHNQAYDKAVEVQKKLLVLLPDDLNAWRHLTAIYIKMNQYGKAADALAVAMQKRLLLHESDYNLLADLYVKSHNPYRGARVLEEGIKANRVTENTKNLDKLYAYWLMAKERIKAIEVLKRAIKIDASIERYLQLARLQHEEQQWKGMRQSVISACKISLPDWHVSSANLLLGISELKLGHRAAARAAFINATLVGGEGDLATQYLNYMEAEEITSQEKEAFGGPCTPKWARKSAKDYSVRTPTEDDFFNEKVEDFGNFTRIDYTLKTSRPKTLVVGEYSIPLVELEKRIRPNAIKLGMYVVKNGGQIDGNMHFIFPEFFKIGTEVLHFSMAFPVSRRPMAKGRYKVINDKGFKSASTIFEGPIEQLMPTWVNFYSTVMADKHSLSGESRQIVLDKNASTNEKIKMELQIGIK